MKLRSFDFNRIKEFDIADNVQEDDIKEAHRIYRELGAIPINQLTTHQMDSLDWARIIIRESIKDHLLLRQIRQDRERYDNNIKEYLNDNEQTETNSTTHKTAR